MRTIDPEMWYLKVKANTRGRRRNIFGFQSAAAFERRLRRSFADAMRDFWVNCSVAGVKYMREKRTSKLARRCRVLFILLLTAFGVALLLHSWRRHRSTPPLVVNLLSAQHPVWDVPFPAAAVCSRGVVSRRALREYAAHLYSLDQNRTYTLAAIERNLLAFGALQRWASVPFDVAFMEYLTRVDHETNVTNVIVRLTPQCATLLKRCSWRAARVPCARLFALRATPHGYCCVFNARYQEEDQHNPVKKLNLVGQDFGLSLVVREDEDDAASVRGAGDGVDVLLFDGDEYPLISSGSTRFYLTRRNMSAFFKLRVTTQQAASDLHNYSEERRGCHSRRLGSRVTERRSRGWCLAACRCRAARTLCGCVPPQLLPAPNDTVCSPDRFECLNKHKEKFTNFYPGESAHPSLSEEMSDSLDCGRCLPDCARLIYRADLSHADYQFTNKLFLNFFVKGMSLMNTTIIRIFYASEDQHLYIVESNLRSYEVAAHLSSLWICVVAVTIVSMAELVYHGTIRWGYHYVRHLRRDRCKMVQAAPSVKE